MATITDPSSEPEPAQHTARARAYGVTQCALCRQEKGDAPNINEWVITTQQRNSLLQNRHQVSAQCANCGNMLVFTSHQPTWLGRIAIGILRAAATITGATAAPKPEMPPEAQHPPATKIHIASASS